MKIRVGLELSEKFLRKSA